MRALFTVTTLLLAAVWASHAAALTAEEAAFLKQQGFSEKTIQLLIQSDMEHMGREAAAPTISITHDNASITYATGPPAALPLNQEERANLESAREMLKDLFIKMSR